MERHGHYTGLAVPNLKMALVISRDHLEERQILSNERFALEEQ
jgi:hypothetical protein